MLGTRIIIIIIMMIDNDSLRVTSSSAGDSSSSPLNAKKEGSPVNVDVNFSALSTYSELIDGNALRT